MKKFDYFRINSIEELKQVYEMFEDEWNHNFYLEIEIMAFNRGYRCIKYDYGGIYLGDDKSTSYYKEIKSPLRNVNNLNKLI